MNTKKQVGVVSWGIGCADPVYPGGRSHIIRLYFQRSQCISLILYLFYSSQFTHASVQPMTALLVHSSPIGKIQLHLLPTHMHYLSAQRQQSTSSVAPTWGDFMTATVLSSIACGTPKWKMVLQGALCMGAILRMRD